MLGRIHGDEVLGWSWLLPPYRWSLGAVVAADIEGVQFDAVGVRERLAESVEVGVLTVVSLYAHRPTPRRATVVLVWTSANLFWDALFHLSTTALFGVYSPGLVTAALLYLPLCLLLAAVAVQERVVSRPRLLATLSGGLVIFGFVVWYGLFHFAV